jgi:hypothetical protein
LYITLQLPTTVENLFSNQYCDMMIESYNGGVREMPSIAKQRLGKHVPVLRNVQTVVVLS